MKQIIALISASFVSLNISSQLISTEPAFPTMFDDIVITYDANLGNAELAGVIPVYAHTGVITNLSDNPNDWRHVVGNWGTNDPQVVMAPQGNNVHQITINPSTFYDLEVGETVNKLAFVFRSGNGALVGRNADGSDIFLQLYDGSFAADFFLPEQNSQIVALGESIDFKVQCSAFANISLKINGIEVANSDGVLLEHTELTDEFGEFVAVYEVDNGLETLSDSVFYIVQPPVTIANPPLGVIDGINYLSASSVILQLHAPNKEYVYAIGDFNDWLFRLDYRLNQTPDGNRWWLQIDDLVPGQEYRFQYFVGDDGLKIADIYSHKILDYWNDPYIPEETYPGLIDYPVGLTSEPVSVLQTNQTPYSWTDQAYTRPAKEKLLVYELLMRDFLERPDYAVMLDTLDYLEELGINAIQFMPINEFEGNNSWGYNPSFYFAPDKYYGTEENLKAFVNECHQRGIAVIMDIALNHSFGQNPQVRLYFDPEIEPYGEPTAENPWFNQQPRHDFNVGYDYNHESPHTRQFVKRVLEYWLDEFHIDGFRFDLSKGFTQQNTLGNLGQWAVYDQSRINILNDYASHMWSVAPGSYVILEHFANNDEETVLANDGMMIWGNVNAQAGEAHMGYSSNLSNGSYQTRGWNDPHLITYWESHDEERNAYRMLNFGGSSGNYDIQNPETAHHRMGLGHAFLIGIPGPKMTWQFSELGYDYSLFYCPSNGTINENCKTDPKPVRWDYYDMESRLLLYKVNKALNRLKTDYQAFSTTDFNIDLGGFGKRIHLNHSSMNVTIIGNFSVSGINIVPGFQHTGTWYDYMSGAVITENDLNNAFFLQPGEYRIYTDVQLPTPDLSVSPDAVFEFFQPEILLVPNPFNHDLQIITSAISEIERVEILSVDGRQLRWLTDGETNSNKTEFHWDGRDNLGHKVSAGVYIIRINSQIGTFTKRVIFEP